MSCDSFSIKQSALLPRLFAIVVLCIYVLYVQLEASETIFGTSRGAVFNSSLCGCSKQMFGRTLKPNKSEFYWCSEESFARGYNQKVVTYALFGNAANSSTFKRYYSLLENISLSVQNYYPEYSIRIYHNIEEQDEGYKSLCNIFCSFSNVDLCSVNTLYKHLTEKSRGCKKTQMPIEPRFIKGLNPKMYRYLVMLDPQVDVFLSRDVDSIIWPREVYAVREWLQSNFTFHLMRDHTAHGSIILAGRKLYLRAY